MATRRTATQEEIVFEKLRLLILFGTITETRIAPIDHNDPDEVEKQCHYRVFLTTPGPHGFTSMGIGMSIVGALDMAMSNMHSQAKRQSNDAYAIVNAMKTLTNSLERAGIHDEPPF